MRVDHRCFDVAMPQQLLNGSNVRIAFEQVRGRTYERSMAPGTYFPPGLHAPVSLASPQFCDEPPRIMRAGLTSVGPRSSSDVARRHASARSNQRFVNSFLCLNLFFAERHSYVHICGVNDRAQRPTTASKTPRWGSVAARG